MLKLCDKSEYSLGNGVEGIEHGLFNVGLSFRIRLESPRKDATNSAIVNLVFLVFALNANEFFSTFTLQKETTCPFETSAIRLTSPCYQCLRTGSISILSRCEVLQSL